MKLLEALLYRMFGRPRGVLGRLGGHLMTGDDKREMVEWTLSELDSRPSDRILEVGFGPGLGIEAAADATSEGFVTGVDYSREMVELAQKRNAVAIDADHVDLRYGSVDNLPYENATFDSAFSINSMHVWPDIAVGLQEIRRVLKPRGRVVLGFTPIAGQSRRATRSALTEAGFTEIRIRERDIGTCVLAVK